MLTIDAIKRDIDKVSLYRHVRTTQDMNSQPTHKKPPLGIKPRKFVTEDRVCEICAGIDRFVKEAVVPPMEWIQELKELIEYLHRVDYTAERTILKDFSSDRRVEQEPYDENDISGEKSPHYN